ncbi:fanconi-associated nuclease 1-like [Pogonomyrmex barbatus]|uniref:Fanconi-associated nuclease n=1 Tax=Pogonomyrmex barbatus TaxID=144034 RepID=A0A6I9WIH0_9HYME|nr:fanconi-associated nuclease 1-like [Pogonomyrmex barbatus]XP_025074694.1 fanconi-associated nuclease 1-like [Pogonomyrmex barbatus]XP_025074695.1 fanconi-associated nuclease 1-like [Pogonomyrmex barbatus]XP_025074696.1 fanconi-associated nuclease 1-like [Pogonomyrmex barbatus]XP_025074697.1 fanconi-associated nuclease 1-like [Pogonomyrmex barbatus]
MAQTKIDQFYKIISSNRKCESVKKGIDKKSSNTRFSIIGKTKEGLSSKLKTSIYKNKQTTSKMSEKQKKQNNLLSHNETSHLCEAYNSPTKAIENYSPTRVIESTTVTSSIAKYTSPIKSQQQTPIMHSGTKFTPKKSSPIKNALDNSSEHAKIVRKKLFKDRIDELISKTIKNLNLAKEGAIADNNINLEKVYSSGKFNLEYNSIDTTTSTRYEINDVIVPVDTYSLHFFLVIVTVFSNPINCGYFDQDERDLIFSLITLQSREQALLIRMLKRKCMWRRISNIKYDEIASDLKPIFDKLISRSIFKSNMEEEDISVLLNLLQVDELRKLCQELKINSSGKKENHIQSILTFCRKTKSLFPGMSSPATKLRASVNKRLGDCILLNIRVKEIVDRIITLLIPNRDPFETLADIFLMLLRVSTDQIKFPEITISDFPIFASKGHLLNYIEAKNTLFNVLSAIEEKQWETVRSLGTIAAQHLSLFLEAESESLRDSTLPRHIRRFMPGYMWLKVLSKSIDAFKKTKETMSQAIEYLQILINQNCHMKNRKGQWYSELIKIEMYHRKNLDASVEILLDAISYENLTEVDRLDLFERAEMIAKKKSDISEQTRNAIKYILANVPSKTLTFQNSITIKGILCGNTSQRKSNWCITNDVDEQIYGSVESLALYHYKCKGYIKGTHCEGAFPITLFTILFWDEIYDMNIPGAWVSLYQDAPLDLYSSEFYENRKKQIDMKLQIVRKFDEETLSRHLKREFDLHCEYKSIFQGNIFDNSNSFQEVTYCLGVEGVVGICERLIHNFPLWTAGFPDLIVWNVHTKQYKIVEVKGPGDSLSTKQKLWLDYLNRLGLNTEVCYCESNASHSKGRKRKHEEL